MAKRKCLKKRSSGYSRHSAGSAILNSDTEILGDGMHLFNSLIG